MQHGRLAGLHRQRGMSYSGAAASIPAMIRTKAAASQSISTGMKKKSIMVLSHKDHIQAFGGPAPLSASAAA